MDELKSPSASILPISSVTRRIAFYMAAIVLWVVSFVFGIYHLAFLFSAVISAFLLSLLWVRVSHLSLMVSVRGPSEVAWGEEFDLIVDITNDSSFSRSLIEVALPKHQWLKVLNGSQRMILSISPRGNVSVEFKLKALKRGVHTCDHVFILARDPFGLFEVIKRFPCRYNITVFPKVISIPAIWRVAGHVLMEMSDGDGDVSRLGMEFFGVREYRPGDPWRRIHWKATAHTGRLSVIELERERQGNATIVVDCEANSHWGDGIDASIEHAATIAASIANELLIAGATVTLIAEPFVKSPGITVEGVNELKFLLHELAQIEPSVASPLIDVIRKLRQTYGRSVGIITVATARTESIEQIIGECDVCAIVHDGFVQIEGNSMGLRQRILRLSLV